MPKQLLKAAWCSAALLGATAQTDDVQALVQHSAQPLSASLTASMPFLKTVNSVNAAKQKATVGRAPPVDQMPMPKICTEQDIEDYEVEVDRIQKLQVQEDARVQAEIAASMPKPEPQSPASVLGFKALQETVMKMSKRVLSKAALDFLPSIVRTRGTVEIPEFNQDKLLEDVLDIVKNPASWSKAMRESLDVLDQELDKTVTANLTNFVAKVPSLRAKKPAGKGIKEIGSYLVRKVLPISFLQTNTDLHMQRAVLELASRIPENPDHLKAFFMGEVMPIVDRAMPELLRWHGAPAELLQLKSSMPAVARTHKAAAPKVAATPEVEARNDPKEYQSMVSLPNHTKFEIPARPCLTCNERYSRQTWGPDNGLMYSCSARCNLVLFSCIAGYSGDCVNKLGSCLKCHTTSLSQLDECTGEDSNAVVVAKFNRTVNLIKHASLDVEKRWEWIDENLAEEIIGSMIF